MSTTIFEFGDIVLVPFPYTNQLANKRRPAVVVSNFQFHHQQQDIILMAVTSQVRSPLLSGEMLITDWNSAGLLKPSVVKPVLMTLQKSLILRRIGHLTSVDLSAVNATLSFILGAWTPPASV